MARGTFYSKSLCVDTPGKHLLGGEVAFTCMVIAASMKEIYGTEIKFCKVEPFIPGLKLGFDPCPSPPSHME